MTADDSRTMRRAFAEFARTAADALAIHPLPIANDIGRAFRRAAAAPLRETKSDGALPHFAPAGKRLRAMINDFFGSVATTNSPLYFAAARLSPHLFWRAAGNGKAPAAAAELIGPSGMAKCSQLRAGLFFQPAEIFYEWHRHAAEEIYLPLGAVSAEWLTAGAPPARIPPPRYVHHRSWQPHAMRTFDSPLAALWGWRGDIAMEHYELCAAPAE